MTTKWVALYTVSVLLRCYSSLHISSFSKKSTVVSPFVNNIYLSQYVGITNVACATLCGRDVFCLSYYYNENQKLCLLNPFVISPEEITAFNDASGLFHYYTRKGSRRPSSCAEIQRDYPESGDGSFWIYSNCDTVYGNRVKVYCHGMAGPSPKEYISLPTPNVGEVPPRTNPTCLNEMYDPHQYAGTTTFSKIRINPFTMKVDSNDVTFATSVGTAFPYGDTGDCYTPQATDVTPSCGPVGTFNVDVIGTGTTLAGNTAWTYDGTTFFAIVNYGSTGRFTVVCGGYCGFCIVDETGIILHINRTEWVDTGTATLLPYD